MLSYNAVAKLCVRSDDGTWNFTNVKVTCNDDFYKIFGSDSVEQVKLSINHMVFYSMNDFENGVSAKVKDVNGELVYMGYRVLVVECDSEKPVDITDDAFDIFRNSINFL